VSRQSGRDNAMTDRPLDNYPTPPWCTDALLEWVMPNVCPELRGPILDPCAGEGGILSPFDEWGIKTAAVEIREECHEILQAITGKNSVIGNFLEMHRDRVELMGARSVVMNPPFSLAKEFVEFCILLGLHDYVVSLLRLPFLATEGRYDWWQSYAPSDVCVMSSRPSFLGKGSDSTEYAWFVWDLREGLPVWPSRLHIIPTKKHFLRGS